MFQNAAPALLALSIIAFEIVTVAAYLAWLRRTGGGPKQTIDEHFNWLRRCWFRGTISIVGVLIGVAFAFPNQIGWIMDGVHLSIGLTLVSIWGWSTWLRFVDRHDPV